MWLRLCFNLLLKCAPNGISSHVNTVFHILLQQIMKEIMKDARKMTH